MTMERLEQATDIQEHPMIGQDSYGIQEIPAENTRSFYEDMQTKITPDIARSLSVRLHNNSAVAGRDHFGDKRPASAYFTEMDGQVLVEWGKIAANGDAKLHDYLNREIDILERVRRGAVIRSGHIGEIRLQDYQDEIKIALFDSLSSDTKVSHESPEFNMTLTLMNHNILPITSDGYPVQFEDYKK